MDGQGEAILGHTRDIFAAQGKATERKIFVDLRAYLRMGPHFPRIGGPLILSVRSRVGSVYPGTAFTFVHTSLLIATLYLFNWTIVYFCKLVVSPFDTRGLVHPSGRRKARFEVKG